MNEPHFNGPEYNFERDHARLKKQHERIRDLMLDGKARSLSEIAYVTGDPPASVSAQLRHLRKKRFGGYIVDRKLRAGERALYEYTLRLPPAEG